jgi:hypothetical protein
MISYDPDRIPEFDPEATEQAMEWGLHPIQVICDEPGAKVGDPAGVSFFAFARFVPRVGEKITLEDGAVCQVKNVHYKVAPHPGTKVRELMANVSAIRISPDRPQ